MKFCIFFSLMALVVCILYVGLWDVKERIYDIVYSCFFLPRPVDDVGRKRDERQEE